MSRRRLLGAMIGALLIVGAMMPAATTARTLQRSSGDHRQVDRLKLDKGLKLKPGQFVDKTANVVVQLKAAPVALRQAAALSVGRQLNKTERATIRAEIKRSQDALRSKIAALGGRILGQYQDAVNGIKVRINLRQTAKLRALPGVASVAELPTYSVDNVHGVPYIGGPATWGQTGKTGAGVKIGIIDTGIDYYHANFGGSGDPNDFANDDSTIIEPGTFPTAKVAGGYDFAGDNYDATGDSGSPIPSPDPDPLDCIGSSPNVGHGSHVAGTAAGEGVLSDGSTFTGPYNATTVSSHTWKIGPGVAPQATLYAYRVFGCAGSTDLVVDAINRAVMDGVDVINMSLGSPFGRNDTIDALAVDNAARAGVVVVTSMGNEGQNAYMAGSPGTADGAIASAAIDAGFASYPGATIGLASGDITGVNANAGTLPVTGPLNVLSDGAGGISLGCDDADYAGVSPGDIVVTLRGTCARTDRAIKGDAAGAAAVIMVNNGGGLPPFEGNIAGVDIPFIGAPGGSDAAFLAADGDTVTISSGGTIPNATYKHLAGFSSGGPRTGDSAMKPDVTAPGVSVVSTLSGSGTEAQTLSGTSMASPHTAGTAALVIQAHPTWTPDKVKAAIMGTSRHLSTGSGIIGYDPRTAGAGVIQARRAVDTRGWATTGWMTSSLSYGYDPRATSYSETKTLTLWNNGTSAITYHLTGTFVGTTFGANLSFSSANVSVPAKGHKNVSVTLALTSAEMRSLPSQDSVANEDVTTIRGYIKATPNSTATGRYTVNVPFLAVPRSLSDIRPSSRAPYALSGSTATTSFGIKNFGNHRGNADIYQWGITDAYDAVGETDVRAVGFQSLPPDLVNPPLDPSDAIVAFMVNMWGRWSNASSNEIDVLIDTNGDGDPDFVVIGIDEGLVENGGEPNGVFVAYVLDVGLGQLIDKWSAIAPTNGSSLILYAAASDFGWADGDGAFAVSVNTYSLIGLADDSTGSALYDPFHPAVSNGDFIPLAGGASATEPAAVDLNVQADAPALGWLFLANDDANGSAQADFVPIGTLPSGP